MTTRRRYLAAIGTGCLTGLAGCQGLLASSDSDDGGTLEALSAEPILRRFAAEDDSVGVRTSRTTVHHADLESLREYDDVIDQQYAETGDVRRFQSDAIKAATERYDATTSIATNGDLTNGRFVEASCSYVEGSVNPDAYDAGSEVDVEATEYGDYELYDYEQRSVALTESATLEGSAETFFPDGDGEVTVEYVPQVRPKIDDLQEGADPPDPVGRGFDAMRPFESVYATIGIGDGEVTLQGNSFEVHGTETTVRRVRAAATEESFEELWNREASIASAEKDYDDPDVSIETGDTLATVTMTVSTAETTIAADE